MQMASRSSVLHQLHIVPLKKGLLSPSKKGLCPGADVKTLHAGRRLLAVRHSTAHRGLTASLGDDGTVRLWGGVTFTAALGILPAAHSRVPPRALAWSMHDEHALALSHADGVVAVYDVRYPSVRFLHSINATRQHNAAC